MHYALPIACIPILLSAVALLGGCSSDGGIFPGSINHNEGAVDYRVAPLRSSTTTSTDFDATNGFANLGALRAKPYVKLSDAGKIRSFSRTETPKSIVDAQNAVETAYRERLAAEDDCLAQTAEHNAAVNGLASAEKEEIAARDAATARRIIHDSFADRISGETPVDATLIRNVLDTKTSLDAAKAARDTFMAGRNEQGSEVAQLSDSEYDARLSELNDAVTTQAEQHSAANAPYDGRKAVLANERDESEKLHTQALDALHKRQTDPGGQDIVAKALSEKEAAEQLKATKLAAEKERRSELDAKLEQLRLGALRGEGNIEKVQSLRLTLKQAYFREFAEPGPVCEVAVLMTVKESRSGLGQQEPKAGRVVYYSDGARKNAFMNFRDQPVYGPIRYGGDDLQIRISVIELDEGDNAIAGAMLKTLATIGSIAYPPSSPVLAALDQIGESLLTLNGPDLELDYLMRLSARPPDSLDSVEQSDSESMYDAWIRDGYYVLIRSDTTNDASQRKRIDPTDWSTLWLDPQSGVLFQKVSNNYQEYTARSYLVFTVQSGFDSSQLDLAQEAADLGTIVNAYGGGSETLGSATQSMADSIRKSIEQIRQLKAQKQRDRNSN